MPPPTQFSILKPLKAKFFTPQNTRRAATAQPFSALLATVSVSLREHLSCLLRINPGAFERTEIDDKHQHMHKPLSFHERWSREVGRGREERLARLLREREKLQVSGSEGLKSVKSGEAGSLTRQP